MYVYHTGASPTECGSTCTCNSSSSSSMLAASRSIGQSLLIAYMPSSSFIVVVDFVFITCVKRRAETGAGEQGEVCLDNAAQGFGICRGHLGDLAGKFDLKYVCEVFDWHTAVRDKNGCTR